MKEDVDFHRQRAQLHAQAVLAFQNLCCLEIETTGLQATDEMIRVTGMNSSHELLDDILICPETAKIPQHVTNIHGLTGQYIHSHGRPLATQWQKIEQLIAGRYLLSFHLNWDIERLVDAALSLQKIPPFSIGEDIRQCMETWYMLQRPSLKIVALAAKKQWKQPMTSVERCHIVLEILEAIAAGRL